MAKLSVLEVILTASTFNALNAFSHGYYFATMFDGNVEKNFGLRTWFGIFLFLAGFSINLLHDYSLMYQRRKYEDIMKKKKGGKDVEKVYIIPKNYLFEYITCPNYFGEIIEWLGWAILIGEPGLSFFLFSVANLLPRAIRTHNWYKEKFEDYPVNRCILIPYLF
ncbi:Steroid 5-alpha-reductase det2 [Lobulomyces angularis]|nr:Steroid 5-alpha-reductase det2 [Lobulomyces angularis]